MERVLTRDADYGYSAFGLLVQKIIDSDGDNVGDQDWSYALDGWNPPKPGVVGREGFDVLAKFDGSSLATRYLWSDRIDDGLGRIDDGLGRIDVGGTTEVRWTLTDFQKSVRTILDGTGAVIGDLAYDAFGNKTLETAPTMSGEYGYTGREWDKETELQYNRARWYDPKTARWLTQDPLGFDAGDTNLYRYVNNRATMATDPSGYWEVVRNSNSKYAVAIAGQQDTINSLGKMIGLDPDEFREWTIPFRFNDPPSIVFGAKGFKSGRFGALPPYEETKWVDLTDSVISFGKLQTADIIRPGQMLRIPNTIYAVWAGFETKIGDAVGLPGKKFVRWDDDVAYLKNRGFHVIEANRPKDFLNVLGDLSSNKQLHGFFLWSHGLPHRVDNVGGEKWTYRYSEMKAALNYGLGFVLLNACFSDHKSGDRDISYRAPHLGQFALQTLKGELDFGGRNLVSRYGRFSGSKEILNPFQRLPDYFNLKLPGYYTPHSHPRDFLKPGEQGTAQ